MSGDGLYQFCYSNYIGCYVATANNTQLQDVPEGGGGGVTCDKVPFREFVHTIATRKTSDRIAQFVVYSNGRQDPVGD